jgi:hypothetical protein
MLKESVLGMIFYNGCSQMEKGQETNNNLFVLTIIHYLSLGACMSGSSGIAITMSIFERPMTMNMLVHTCAFHQTHIEHISGCQLCLSWASKISLMGAKLAK